jgi:hypothetical protein
MAGKKTKFEKVPLQEVFRLLDKHNGPASNLEKSRVKEEPFTMPRNLKKYWAERASTPLGD